jgi:hypothetical protein
MLMSTTRLFSKLRFSKKEIEAQNVILCQEIVITIYGQMSEIYTLTN